MKHTSEKLEEAGFEQAMPNDKLFRKKKVLMTFIVKCTFLQIVSALHNVSMTFNSYKDHL